MNPPLREWTIDSKSEPIVRIGVVLEEDATDSIEIRPDPQTTVKVAHTADNAVTVSLNGGPPVSAASWTHTPANSTTLAKGNGDLVKGIVAGRGFHWQKRVDQTLAGKIEILPGSNGLILVNELPLEWYLAGVITSEMSSKCPIEFLRAQCITARSWLLAFTEPKHRRQPFDRCNDDCCQRYQGTGDLSKEAVDAVESTRGLCLVAEGGVVDANYSKSCGGVAEVPEHVWGVRKPGLGPLVDAPKGSKAEQFLPVTDQNIEEYLSGTWLRDTDIYCSDKVIPENELGQYLGRVDETGHYFRWKVKYSKDELRDLLASKNHPEFKDLKQVLALRVTNRGLSGRAMEIVFTIIDSTGSKKDVTVRDQYKIRQLLHKSFLFSSAFVVDTEGDSFTLRGAGWGHGAGLCQIGALGMSLRGVSHDKIVLHYFPGAELKKLYGST